MKRTISISGIMSCILIASGIFLKIHHLAGAGITLCVGITFLVLVFLPSALINNYRNEENRPGKWFYIITYITCIVLYTATLFKIMHWPGAGRLLLIAIPFPFIVFLPIFLYYSRKEEFFSITQSIVVIFLLAYVSVMTAILALNISKSMLDDSIRIQTDIRLSDMQLFQKKDEIATKINQLKKNDIQVKLNSITNQGKAIYSLIDTIKWEIIRVSDPEYENVPLAEIDLSQVRGKDNKENVQMVMFGDQEYALKLKNSFDHYKKYVLEMLPSEQMALRQFVEKSFSTSTIKFHDREIPWENFCFSNVQMVWAQSNLTQFQSNVLSVESELLDCLYFAELVK